MRAALLHPVLVALREYLCQPVGFRHAAAIVEAHLRYLREVRPRVWQQAVELLSGWAKLLKQLRQRKPPGRRALVEQWLGGASGGDAVALGVGSHLTERHLEALQGLAEAFVGMVSNFPNPSELPA